MKLPINRKQKFQIGEKVFIDVQNKWKSHFITNCYGIVMGTYAQQFGEAHGTRQYQHYSEYTIMILDENGNKKDIVSWYNEDELTLINEFKREDGMVYILEELNISK